MTKPTLNKRSALKCLSFGMFGSLLYGCATHPVAKVDHKRPSPSLAQSLKEYRRDAAKHLYDSNGHQIYSGKLPPMLYAVGVLRLEIAANGDLKTIDWMRKPTHAPEVVHQIEEKIRLASPFPAAKHLGDVTYTETWLWHKSGRFQLDTLTEGQT